FLFHTLTLSFIFFLVPLFVCSFALNLFVSFVSPHDALPISFPRRWQENQNFFQDSLDNPFAFCYNTPCCWTGTRICWCSSAGRADRKSTRLNSSHVSISYAVFCLKKKKYNYTNTHIQTILHS